MKFLETKTVLKNLPIRFCRQFNRRENTSTLMSSIFASQGLRYAVLIFTLGIARRIFEVTRWRFICNAASDSTNNQNALYKKHMFCRKNVNKINMDEICRICHVLLPKKKKKTPKNNFEDTSSLENQPYYYLESISRAFKRK